MSVEEPIFFVTGGTLRPDAPSYLERRADSELLDSLVQGEFCYILTSRQMGKSSLMVRTVLRLRREKIAVAVLDLTSIGQNLTAEQWYDGLIVRLGQQMDLEEELEEFWRSQERLGPLQRWSMALEKLILPRCTGPVVIFVDEIDVVRSLPFSTDEFFGAIRECYNRRSRDPEFNRLTFCLLGVATPTDLIHDTRLTPFNVGRRIELNDFTPVEAAALTNGLRRQDFVALSLLERVLYWTHGHPYLTQRLCRAIASEPSVKSPAEVDRLCDELFSSHQARERDDNLIFVRERMLNSDVDRASLLDLYGRVRRGQRVADDETNPLVSILRLAGITRGSDGVLKVRNRIYEKVFDPHWIKANLPEAERRRQRVAFRRGAARAAAVTLAIVAMAVFLTVYRRPLSKAQQLPDGSQLVLEKAEYGKWHPYEPGQLRLGWLREFLPAPMRNRVPSGGFGTGDDSLVLWTRQTGMKRSETADWRWFVVDEQGFELYLGALTPSYSAQPKPSQPGWSEIKAWNFPIFPRRGKTVDVRIYKASAEDRQLWSRIAQFKIRNPTFGVYPTWTPEPMPISKSFGDLSFTLFELTGGTKHSELFGTNRVAESDAEPWSEAMFQIRRNGEPTRDWRASLKELSDATGNTVSLSSNSAVIVGFQGVVEVTSGDSSTWSPAATNQIVQPGDRLRTGMRSGATVRLHNRRTLRMNQLTTLQISADQVYDESRGILSFNGALPDGEVWKLRVEFSQVPDTNDVWTLSGLSIPRPGSITQASSSSQLQGATVQLTGASTSNAISPTLQVRIISSPPDARLKLVKVRDDLGQETSFFETASTETGPGWGFNAATNATSLDLTFSVRKTRTIEFRAVPSSLPQRPPRPPPRGRPRG